MLFIVIGNAIVFLFQAMDTTNTFIYYLYFNPTLILHGQIWRLITFIFVPASSNLFFLAVALYFYYFIGSTLERLWGVAKFTLYYLFGIFFTMLYGIIASFFVNTPYIFLDAAYINLSMFFAFAVLFPDMQVLLFFVIPIKIKWLAMVNAVVFALSVFFTPFPQNLLPLVALMNFFIFCGGYLADYVKRSRAGNSKAARNFRVEATRAKNDLNHKPYRHKCAVCGRTDTDYPDLEFRYCSQCDGYHCFCQDHINNHVHFKE